MHGKSVLTALLAVVLGVVVVRAGEGDEEGRWLDAHLNDVGSLYRELHGHPELSGQEVQTASRLAQALSLAGVEVTRGVGRTGVVGVVRNGRGPTVLLRTDMDALPVTEATGLPYASTVRTVDQRGVRVGLMHACGHDLHMANLAGTARWLSDHRSEWAGTVVLVGQPAEESGSGARWMLEDGLYTRFPRPDYAIAVHVAHNLPVGTIGLRSGPVMAGTTAVTITVNGRGGHGALPQTTVDPIVLASALVLDLQTIVSRELNPRDHAVVTVGSIQGGTESNIIPDSVRLKLTLRAFRPEVHDQLVDGIRRRAVGLAQAHKAPAPHVDVGGGVPPLVNDPTLVARVLPDLVRVLGAPNVIRVPPEMTAEDFGLFAQGHIPTLMLRLGVVSPAVLAKAESGSEPLPSLHSPHFAPDAIPALRTGIRALAALVKTLLPPAAR